MPAWWGRKSSKTKTDQPLDKSLNPYSNRYASPAVVTSPPINTKRDRSLDELTPRGSPRGGGGGSKDLGTVISGTSLGIENEARFRPTSITLPIRKLPLSPRFQISIFSESRFRPLPCASVRQPVPM